MISLKKADFSDIEFLWYLRNQPDSFKYSKIKKPVNWQEHIRWIMPIILGQNNKELFVIKSLETPTGQIRFDRQKNKEAEVSISILKDFWGKGFATESLGLAIEEAKKENKISLLTAVIHKENLDSQKLFKKLD